jgi:hypothetical protein
VRHAPAGSGADGSGAALCTLGTCRARSLRSACRMMARSQEKAAQQIGNPSLRGPVEDTAKRPVALAEKFERARNVTDRLRD